MSDGRRGRSRRALLSLLVAATLGLSSLGLSSCAAFTDDSPAASGKVSVVAAFYPLQFVAETVGGSAVVVTNLTQPGAEPHDLELSIAETAEVSQADVVVYLNGFQAAVDAAAGQATGEILDVGPVAGLEETGHHGHDHEGGEEHESSGEAGLGDLDPHFWQDPLKLAAVADAVADRLATVDPDHAADYRARATDLRADLERLDGDFAAGLRSCKRHTVVVSHDAFGYLTRYGLEFESIAGLSPDAEPTPADLARLQDLIRSDQITTVFGERLASPKMAQTLADDLGISMRVLDPIEGLDKSTADEDYLSLMRQNLAELQEANQCR
ncbi:MAG: metal ABC transporter substrate-binding protein [Nocardioides sp.]|uniref:metal ABC transporter substrate-binding protein n=1 Tax=Nocardioides sp. TaxID=35761 RepID=UPI0039E34A9F